jgi:oxygen-independent coproporphyrinogen III oxidase
LVKDPQKVNFSYRDHLFSGSDLLATGVASFGHVSGVHYQNKTEWADYTGTLLNEGRLPLGRALRPTKHQLLIRELILLLKKAEIHASYFAQKFGVNIFQEWAEVWAEYQREGYVQVNGDSIQLTRAGLLRVDGLLPAFFEPEHRGVRYT